MLGPSRITIERTGPRRPFPDRPLTTESCMKGSINGYPSIYQSTRPLSKQSEGRQGVEQYRLATDWPIYAAFLPVVVVIAIAAAIFFGTLISSHPILSNPTSAESITGDGYLEGLSRLQTADRGLSVLQHEVTGREDNVLNRPILQRPRFCR